MLSQNVRYSIPTGAIISIAFSLPSGEVYQATWLILIDLIHLSIGGLPSGFQVDKTRIPLTVFTFSVPLFFSITKYSKFFSFYKIAIGSYTLPNRLAVSIASFGQDFV